MLPACTASGEARRFKMNLHWCCNSTHLYTCFNYRCSPQNRVQMIMRTLQEAVGCMLHTRQEERSKKRTVKVKYSGTTRRAWQLISSNTWSNNLSSGFTSRLFWKLFSHITHLKSSCFCKNPLPTITNSNPPHTFSVYKYIKSQKYKYIRICKW